MNRSREDETEHFSGRNKCRKDPVPCLFLRLEDARSCLPVYMRSDACQAERERNTESEMINMMKNPFTFLNKSHTLISTALMRCRSRRVAFAAAECAVIPQQRDPAAPALADKYRQAGADSRKRQPGCDSKTQILMPETESTLGTIKTTARFEIKRRARREGRTLRLYLEKEKKKGGH